MGQRALLSIALGNICTSLILIPIVTALLNTDNTAKESLSKIFVKVFTKPLVLAPILGSAYSLCGLHLPVIIQNTLGLIGSSTPAVSLFALGLIMSGFTVRFNRLVAMNIGLKNIVHPLIMMGLVTLLGIKGELAKEAILLCAMPTATMVTMFALKYDVLAQESTSSTILGTLLSLLTLTIFMMLVSV